MTAKPGKRPIVLILIGVIVLLVAIVIGLIVAVVIVGNKKKSDNGNNGNCDQSSSGTVPTVSGTVPTVSNTVPTVSTTVPTVSSTIPTVSTTVPTVSSTVPTVSSTVPTVSGTFPTGSDTTPLRNRSAYHERLFTDTATQEMISKKLMDTFVPMNIRDNLRWISSRLHVAGTENNTMMMRRLADNYRQYGFDDVQTPTYQVLLNYPDYDNPNTIDVQELEGTWIQMSNGLAEVLGPKEAQDQQDDPKMLVWWNGYSANGTVTGTVVYANYGTRDDFGQLDTLKVNLTGTIVLIRYGQIYRGAKVFEAERRGAVGVVMFMDPADFAPISQSSLTFPDNMFMPPSGAQRGSLLETDGDPETPFFPAKDYTFRTENEQSLRASETMPKVPVMPIGYRDAIKIMGRLDGQEVQAEWKGAMNVTYRQSGSAIFRLSVRSTTERRTIMNVIATMRGIDEPDRAVVYGNHADAWVKGAIDPNSGTATLHELGRVFASVINETGWRPRRTIVICHWDAEEYGLIGSTEFVEEYLKSLQIRAVAYINLDNMSGNKTVQVMGLPMVYRTLAAAAKKIPSPDPLESAANRTTLYDTWNFYYPNGPMGLPYIELPGSGSDHSRFINYAGVTVMDIHFTDPVDGYDIYHSMYEIPWTIENIMDTDFKAFTACGQMLMEVGRNLADSLIIPFNVVDYVTMLTEYLNDMDQKLQSNGDLITALGNSNYTFYISNVQNATSRMAIAATAIQKRITEANDGTTAITVRQAEMLNSRLMSIERAFINDYGIYEERKFYRHLVFANSQYDEYAGVTFAGIMDPAVDWANAIASGDSANASYWLDTVRLGFTKVQYAIESAILLLNLNGFDD